MMSSAFRFIASKGNKSTSAGSISLACHVKPGANAKREGVNSVSDDGVELCVSAQAKEGEANKAVQKLIAEVCIHLRFIPGYMEPGPGRNAPLHITWMRP